MADVNVQRLEPYKPPFSVWKLIQDIVPAKELPLVKSYVGESSIEYSIDLRNELEILLDIWKEIGEQSEPPIVTKNVAHSVLAGPPKLKGMLTKEIQMLVKDIQEKGGSPNESKYDEQDRKVIQYALHSQQNESERPKTPFRTRACDVSSSPLKLRQIKRNINATSIEAVSDLLKDALQNECKQLEEDIQFLQKCVEEEHEVVGSRPSSPLEEPSIAQLRQVCRTLEVKALSRESTSSRLGATDQAPVIKRPTPPSPQRVQLKPIEPSNPPSTRDSVSFRSRVNFNPDDVGDNWIEPVWSKSMSDSPPPSTGDSGVSSRPGTCELSALHERRKHLATPSSGCEIPSIDVGYLTGNSLDASSRGGESEHGTGKSESAPNISPPSTTASISPHPPKGDVLRLSRKNVNARRFSRKLVQTS